MADGEEWAVRLFVLQGDQLELNKRCGLSTNFNADYVCRYSLARKNDRVKANSLSDIQRSANTERSQAIAEEAIVCVHLVVSSFCKHRL